MPTCNVCGQEFPYGPQGIAQYSRHVDDHYGIDNSSEKDAMFQMGKPMSIAWRLLKDEIAGSDQHAETGDPRFWNVMRNFGTQDDTVRDTPFLPYDSQLGELGPNVDEMLTNYGYKPFYFGGRYPMPDFSKKNYTTGDLGVYDPGVEATSFADKGTTDNWRKIHELGHALGLEELNDKWGEGRRLGKLGTRTPREMLRAVDWERLALENQRKLMQELGLPITNEQYNRDWNTTIGDAAFRGITGKFTSPEKEGFSAFADRRVPVDTGMKLVQQRADELGLDMNQTLRDKRGGARKIASEPMDLAWRLLKHAVSPEAKRHKSEYDSKYESTPERKKYHVDLNRERRKRGIYGHGGPDMSHTKDHTLVAEDPHTNRARHFKERGTLK